MGIMNYGTSYATHKEFLYSIQIFSADYYYVCSRLAQTTHYFIAFHSLRNNNSLDYDKEKYKEMLLDAAETVLGIFGFDRILFGKAKDKKWWMQLGRNREFDVKAEINSY